MYKIGEFVEQVAHWKSVVKCEEFKVVAFVSLRKILVVDFF